MLSWQTFLCFDALWGDNFNCSGRLAVVFCRLWVSKMSKLMADCRFVGLVYVWYWRYFQTQNIAWLNHDLWFMTFIWPRRDLRGWLGVVYQESIDRSIVITLNQPYSSSPLISHIHSHFLQSTIFFRSSFNRAYPLSSPVINHIHRHLRESNMSINNTCNQVCHRDLPQSGITHLQSIMSIVVIFFSEACFSRKNYENTLEFENKPLCCLGPTPAKIQKDSLWLYQVKLSDWLYVYIFTKSSLWKKKVRAAVAEKARECRLAT